MDSNDRDRIQEVKEEVWRMMAEDELKDALFLVMANKQDLPNAMSVEEITEKLEMNKIRNREWCKWNLLISLPFSLPLSLPHPPSLPPQAPLSLPSAMLHCSWSLRLLNSIRVATKLFSPEYCIGIFL